MISTLDLLSILADAGVSNLREGTKEISGSCPQHLERLGKEDYHSSWSMNRITFLHNCFSCGYSGTLNDLLVDQLGSAPDNLEHELAKRSFLANLAQVERPSPQRVIAEPRPNEPVVNDWSLENLMTDVPQKLVDFRHLQRTAVETYGIRWDPERRAWVLPIRAQDGSLLGAQFRQKGNELNLPKGLEKSAALFGLAEMRYRSTVALVESPLDAVRLYGVGVPAVASFGAWVSPEQCRLLARNFTKVVLALDNDPTGRKAAVDVGNFLRQHKVAVAQWDYTGLVDADGVPAKDPGDVASDTELWHAWLRSKSHGL